ncbi:MAG: hypothetical protein ACPG5U_00010 [Planktomarina sp.]
MSDAPLYQRIFRKPRTASTPEAETLVAVCFFGVSAIVDVIAPQDRIQASSIPFITLWAMTLYRHESYSGPSKRLSVYGTFYHSLKPPLFYMSLFVTTMTIGGLIACFLISFILFGIYAAFFQKPAPRSQDWHQLYQMPSQVTGRCFAAIHVHLWPFVTLAVIFGTLALTRTPAWAILAGSSCLAFTPLAYPRNPLTGRPVLSKLFNLLAVCLITFAAITLIQKGH